MKPKRQELYVNGYKTIVIHKDFRNWIAAFDHNGRDLCIQWASTKDELLHFLIADFASDFKDVKKESEQKLIKTIMFDFKNYLRGKKMLSRDEVEQFFHNYFDGITFVIKRGKE